MTKDKDKLIGAALTRGLAQAGIRGEAGSDHPDPETFAAVVEGTVHGDERDRILKHISACDTCYETFLLTTELQADLESGKEKARVNYFRPLALAASILIVVLSIYVFYQSEDMPKTRREFMEKSEASGDAFTYSKKDAPAEAAAMKKAPKKKAEPELSAPAPKKSGTPAGRKTEPPKYKVAGKVPAPRKAKALDDELVEKEEEADTAPGVLMEKKKRQKRDLHVPPEKRVGKSVSQARVVETKEIETPDQEPVERVQRREKSRYDFQKKESVPPVRGRLTRENLPPIQSQAVSLNIAVQQIPSYIPRKDIGKLFKETLTLSRKMGKEYESVRKEAERTGNYSMVDSYVSGLDPLITVKTVGDTPHIAPNINWFFSRSDPQSVENRFFALARSGWCDTTDFCYDLQGELRRYKQKLNIADKEGRREESDGSRTLLSQWRELHPGLKGIFKKVARRTIVNLEKTQK